jgi:hypothetical protein
MENFIIVEDSAITQKNVIEQAKISKSYINKKNNKIKPKYHSNPKLKFNKHKKLRQKILIS